MATYEQLLDADPRWAMSEGSRHFEEDSSVQKTLRKITRRLQELEIPYSVAGGMALFAHGLRRFTEDVDLIVNAEGLKALHRELAGAGFRPPFPGSRNLRDAETGVRIEFLVTGQFPGDGQPKPVAFPPPASAVIEQDGILYVNLPTLVELKLASGMSNPQRLKDLADVQELIKLLALPAHFADALHPSVRGKYREMRSGAEDAPGRFVRLWQNKNLNAEAEAALNAMRADGVTLETRDGAADDPVWLVTTDPAVARKHDMHDEAEFL